MSAMTSMSSLSASQSSHETDENTHMHSGNLLEDVQIVTVKNNSKSDLKSLVIPTTPKASTRHAGSDSASKLGHTLSTPKTPSQLLAGTPFASPAPPSTDHQSPFHSATPTSWAGSGTSQNAVVDKDSIVISREDFAKVVELKNQFDLTQDELYTAQTRIQELEDALKALRRENDTKLREVFEDHLRSQEQSRRLSQDIQKQIERYGELQQRYEALEAEQQLLIRERDFRAAESAGQAEELVLLRAHAERLASRLEALHESRYDSESNSDDDQDELGYGEDTGGAAAQESSEGNLKDGCNEGQNIDADSALQSHPSRKSHRSRRTSKHDHAKEIAELQGQLRQMQIELIQERNMNEKYCETINTQQTSLDNLSAAVAQLKQLDTQLRETTNLSEQSNPCTSDSIQPRPSTEAWLDASQRVQLELELADAKLKLQKAHREHRQFSLFTFVAASIAVVLVLVALIYY